MKCPSCPDAVLVMTDRSGIEIDYCPSCRGVWLDRGELDKIIERTAAAPAAVVVTSPAPTPSPQDGFRRDDRSWKRDDDHDDDDRRRYSSDGYKPKKKKSLLGEMFDF